MRGDAEYCRSDTTLSDLPAADFAQRYHYNLHQLWRQSGCELVVEIGPGSMKRLRGTAPIEARAYAQCSEEDLVRHLVSFAIRQQKNFVPSTRVLYNLTPFFDPSIFWCPPDERPTLTTGLTPHACHMVARVLGNVMAEVHHHFSTVIDLNPQRKELSCIVAYDSFLC